MNELFKKRVFIQKSYADIGLAVTFVVLCLYMLLIGNDKYIKIGFGAVGVINDRLFPTILMVVAIICSVAIAFFGFQDVKRDKMLKQEGKEVAKIEISIMAILLLVPGVFFYLTMKTIGYPLCSFISIYAVYYLHGGRKIWKGALVAGIFTLACYLFFGVYLGVNLPLGFGM